MKLAIKGHLKRGNEVIKILEMLGGINKLDLKGTTIDSYYYIDNTDNKIHLGMSIYPYEYIIYSLEEFLEKFPYKVGDKVWLHHKNLDIRITETITSMRWCSKNDCVLYNVYICCNLKECAFTPYKEETVEEKETTGAIVDRFICLEGYDFYDDKGNIIDTKEITMKKKHPEYPKTFIEVLNFWHPDRQIEDDYQRYYKKDLIEKFQDLLYARDAYWKIAGEQMGLGKPWDSVYGCGEWGYWIGYDINESKIYCQDSRILLNHLLVFPTAEMRDAFYENFKELIENCKELL